MNIAMILAGGIGTRMGVTSTPKQYLNLGGKPIIIHTAEKFMINTQIDKVLVLVPHDWKDYTVNLFKENTSSSFNEKLVIVEGGKERHATIKNGLDYLINRYGDKALNFNVITHDAVRPFVTKDIIEKNIMAIQNSKCVDTIIPATDTIVQLDNKHEQLIEVPNRNNVFQGQTPQTFVLKDYLKIYNKLSEEELEEINDVCKMFVDQGIRVDYVVGDISNFKITTQHDYFIAQYMVESDKYD